MDNFIYYAPTKIYFGTNNLENIVTEIKSRNYKKILLHYGMSSIKKIGLYDEIIKLFNENNIDFVELSGVLPNPKLSKVIEGVKLVKEENVDLILAVGGGSVIDSAKSIACGAKTDLNPWLFNTHEKTPKDAIDVGVVLTISAAGSEMSNSCVITNDKTNDKRGFNTDIIRPKFAILDPTYTFTVSKYQTACGICDILMHTLERFVSEVNVENDLTDNLAIALIKSVLKYGKIAIENPSNYEARATLMWASSVSHNGLTSCGRKFIMSVHQIEHALSGIYDEISHGEGLSILWPNWAKFALKSAQNRFSKLAYEVLNVNRDINEEEAGLIFINYLQNYFKEIGLKTTLSECNITKNDLEPIALLATFNKTRIIKDVIDTDYKLCLDILNEAL